MTDTDNKLRALVANLTPNNTNTTTISAPATIDAIEDEDGDLSTPTVYSKTIEDIDDLTKPITGVQFQRTLNNTDFLVLSDLSEGKGLTTIANQHSVSESYIKKLMRSDAGNNFLQTQSKQKSELALALTTTAVANGVNKYVEMVDELFEKGNTSLGLNYLFGKMSLMEVQAMLHKQQEVATPDETDSLKNLFLNIAVGNRNG